MRSIGYGEARPEGARVGIPLASQTPPPIPPPDERPVQASGTRKIELMEKRSVFGHRLFPYALLVPQIAITLIFFYWPAIQAVWQSFLLQDAFGLSTSLIWFDTSRELLTQPEYFHTIATTLFFSAAVAILSLSCALL